MDSHCVQDVGNGSQASNDGEDGQRQVPEDEKSRQLESFPTIHPLLHSKHQHEVDGDDDERNMLVPPEPYPQIMIHYGGLEWKHCPVLVHVLGHDFRYKDGDKG